MKHQTISFVKSAIRLIGYLFLMGAAPVACFILFISEVIGIVEEIGHD